jgi:hypothetical protein
MTNARATAYRRVLHTIRDIGPAKLWPAEQACIREAADTLLFCHELSQDVDARAAVMAVTRLADDLIYAERMTSMRGQRLLDDIWACGPSAVLELPVAA